MTKVGALIMLASIFLSAWLAVCLTRWRRLGLLAALKDFVYLIVDVTDDNEDDGLEAVLWFAALTSLFLWMLMPGRLLQIFIGFSWQVLFVALFVWRRTNTHKPVWWGDYVVFLSLGACLPAYWYTFTDAGNSYWPVVWYLPALAMMIWPRLIEWVDSDPLEEEMRRADF